MPWEIISSLLTLRGKPFLQDQWFVPKVNAAKKAKVVPWLQVIYTNMSVSGSPLLLFMENMS